MKKRAVTVLAVVMTAALLAACGAAGSENASSSAESVSSEETSSQAESVSSEETSSQAESVSSEVSAPEEVSSEEESAEPEEKITLNVFAAASMTETLTEIESLYEAAHGSIDLVFTFDSSGTLKTQIEEGADCDIFISAAPKQMNQLDITADPEVNENGLDFVLEGTRIDLLENKVVLCVPEGNPKNIDSYEDLANALKEGSILFAMGNEDVPVGQYTQKIFAYFGIEEEAVASNITYGSNVKEVTTAVVEGTADAGVVYATDAFSAGLTPVDVATAEMCGQVIYPAAVLNITKNESAASDFLSYLTTDEASKVFEAVGFTPLT